ncbi:carboxylesterase family protein [Chryseobacterium gregarium]|uniref:carboxylesterase family protein n=1 Tax=Chryseobacterium gregarium TaxID=456299 RepID=UPI0004841823|nr:dienelactone hydrolase family protein [Chryseobacterium gregarium]
MNYQLKFLINLTVITLNIPLAFGQISTSDHSKIDSLTFSDTKAILNNLLNASFEKRIFNQDNEELPYRLLLPKNYDPAKKYPAVLTFHNSTRIGNDNERQLEPLAKIWLRNEIYERYNCFVVAPQFNERSSNYLENGNGILVSKGSDATILVLKLLRKLEQEYPNMDKSKIYLVGYSMGASTAQNLMSLAPEEFAAMVSIAAVPDFSHLKALASKNIYLIHGAKDFDNPYKGSDELYKKLKNSNKVLFKTFTELDHNNITIPLLLSDEIPKWLFKQKK